METLDQGLGAEPCPTVALRGTGVCVWGLPSRAHHPSFTAPGASLLMVNVAINLLRLVISGKGSYQAGHQKRREQPVPLAVGGWGCLFSVPPSLPPSLSFLMKTSHPLGLGRCSWPHGQLMLGAGQGRQERAPPWCLVKGLSPDLTAEPAAFGRGIFSPPSPNGPTALLWDAAA